MPTPASSPAKRRPRCPACRAAWVAPYRTGHRWSCGSSGADLGDRGWFFPSPICESLESLLRACADNAKRVAAGASPAITRGMSPLLVGILRGNIEDAGYA